MLIQSQGPRELGLGSVARHVFHQVFFSIQVLLGISVILFIMASVYPGNPVTNLSGFSYETEARKHLDLEELQPSTSLLGRNDEVEFRQGLEELQHRFGGDVPGPVRYLFWMKEVLTGNLGVSVRSPRPVVEIIREAIPVTLGLVAVALLIASIVGTALGTIAAKFQRSILIHSLDLIFILFASIPPVLLSLWSMYIFAVLLGWLPIVGLATPGAHISFNLDLILHSILPVSALALPCIAIYMRYKRQSLLDSHAGEPGQTAPTRSQEDVHITLGRMFHRAWIPSLRSLSLSLPLLVGGTLVVETLFLWPGLGSLMFNSLVQGDYPILTAALLTGTVAVLAVRLLADLISGCVDPRARGSSQDSMLASNEPTTASHDDATTRQIGPPLELIDRPLEHRPWSMARRRFLSHWPAVAGFALLLGFVAVAVVAPFAAPYGPYDVFLTQPLAGPTAAHWLGTDRFGRDVFSLLLHGARTALSVGVIAVAISLAVGCAVGGAAGRFGGRIDSILMRITDLVMTFPALFLMVPMILVLGPWYVALIIGIISWPGIARLIRRQVLVQRRAANTADVPVTGSDRSDMRRRLLQNMAGPAAVAAAYGLAGSLLTDFTLSAMGLGSPLPAINWGQMILTSGGNPLALAPAMLIVLLVLSVHLVGDGLRNAFDARR